MPFPYPISSPTNTNVQCVESIEDIYKSNSKCPANNFLSPKHKISAPKHNAEYIV